MLHTDELDYFLPSDLIARTPAHPRDHSRLLIYRRGTESIEHLLFSDLPDILNPGDLLIANDTRVLPAKLSLTKETGGMITGLFIAEISPGKWRVMLRTRGRARPGICLTAKIINSPEVIRLKLLERDAEKGQWIVEVSDPRPAVEVLARIGQVPLPPYIEKARTLEQQRTNADQAPAVRSEALEGIKPQATIQTQRHAPAADRPTQTAEQYAHDAESYQTIYAQAAGALAAPTAGLHFTPEVFARLTQRRIDRTWVTLHVGLGTFLPVEAATLDQHPMHQESFFIPRGTVEKIRHQRSTRNRMVLVGTTTVRTLETMAQGILDPSVPAQDFTGTTNLLIQPGYNFNITDALITNFHLPRSTLLALVAALVSLDRLKDIYQQAIAHRYRFYSFGDAMLILP